MSLGTKKRKKNHETLIVILAISQFTKLGLGPAAVVKLHHMKYICKANISQSDYDIKDRQLTEELNKVWQLQ